MLICGHYVMYKFVRLQSVCLKMYKRDKFNKIVADVNQNWQGRKSKLIRYNVIKQLSYSISSHSQLKTVKLSCTKQGIFPKFIFNYSKVRWSQNKKKIYSKCGGTNFFSYQVFMTRITADVKITNCTVPSHAHSNHISARCNNVKCKV